MTFLAATPFSHSESFQHGPLLAATNPYQPQKVLWKGDQGEAVRESVGDMKFMTGIQADQNWQRGNKFSPIGFLQELGLKALTLALVGRSQNPQVFSAPNVTEKLSDPSRRNRLR